jgi:hypothetical protein
VEAIGVADAVVSTGGAEGAEDSLQPAPTRATTKTRARATERVDGSMNIFCIENYG